MRGKHKKRQTRARRRALAVLARMRSRGESLSEASRNEHTAARTVRLHVGSALLRDPRTRRFVAKDGDTFRRDIYILGYDSYVPVTVRSSKKGATCLGTPDCGESISEDGRHRMAQAIRCQASRRR